ncbi:MAG: tryptophan 2,3-dioxygenase family protein [Gemmatimonadota bacterium]
MTLTYPDYLQLEHLLGLQKPRSEPAEHDEMLFIVIHQVYELWFKLVLHELEKIKVDLVAGDLFGAITSLKRVRTVMKTLVGQLDILETMTPLSFSSFRDRLDTASGFQSVQFRELEFELGNKKERALEMLEPGSAERKRLENRYRGTTVQDAFYRFLALRGLKVPQELLDRDVTQPTTASEPLQAELLAAYKKQPELVILLELMTDFDEGLQEWRYRHVKLAERTIGAKRGTGGSAGVEFLKQSLFKPVFPDLWAIRHQM